MPHEAKPPEVLDSGMIFMVIRMAAKFWRFGITGIHALSDLW
jgi:hypothetical protein